MSFLLDEEQQLIQQNARDFAEKYIAPIAGQMDREDFFPRAVVAQLAENDFMGFYLPGEYGGAEAGYLSYVLAVEAIARSSAGVAAVLVNHASLASYALHRWGTEWQKRGYLSALCSGKKLGAFALTEPGSAPGVGPDRVIAVREGAGYVLNGRKAYVSNGGVADVYIVFAVDPEKGRAGMSAFIVDADMPGLSVSRRIGKLGLRACPWADLSFSDVQIPADHLLGAEGAGLMIIQETKSIANIAEGALVVGVVQAAMEDAAQYSKQRVQFGQAICNFPAVQNMLAEMATNIHLARLAVYDAASAIDRGEAVTAASAMIKLFVNRISQMSLSDAIQIEGGYGYIEDMAVSRYFREVKGVLLSDSSADFPEQIIAKELLS